MTDAKTVQRRFVDEFQTGGKADVLTELVAADFVDHSPAPGVPPTREGVGILFGALRQAMPDLHVEVHDMIGEDDTVATRKTLVGTQTGELFGQPATGKEIRIEVFDFVRHRDGKIAEHWNLVDTYGLMMQLGALPG